MAERNFEEKSPFVQANYRSIRREISCKLLSLKNYRRIKCSHSPLCPGNAKVISNKRQTDQSTKKSFDLKAYSYNDLVRLSFIIAVCKRCKANLATLSKREPDLVDNDGDHSDDGNEGDDDDNDESDEELSILS